MLSAQRTTQPDVSMAPPLDTTHPSSAERVSLLCPDAALPAPGGPVAPPAYFRDLNLDQVLDALVGSADPRGLTSLFCTPVLDTGVLRYRQEVFADLHDDAVLAVVADFTAGMSEVTRLLASLPGRRDARERHGGLLDAASRYVAALTRLDEGLGSCRLRSPGLRRVRDAIGGYRASQEFSRLDADAARARRALEEVRYCVRVRGLVVEVSRYQGQPDFSEEVAGTFRRFQQGQARDYRLTYRSAPELGHVTSLVLDQLVRLFPDEFAMLEEFCARHSEFVTEQVSQLDRELAFFLTYLDYIAPMRSAGLPFCRPEVSDEPGGVLVEDTFDLALARKLVAEGAPVVLNSIRMTGEERILVVSGPNQGGKTTYARTFGQLHHLAALGCPVPGSAAELGVFDHIFCHFHSAERVGDLRGRLEDDLVRVRRILEEMTERSIVVLNETFSSTTLEDARFLGTKLLEQLLDRRVRAVYVSFVDELANLGGPVVSLVSQVVPEDPAQRTLRIVRARADGLAYAQALAEKYGLTYQLLRKELDR